jgi:hypothetical protein
VALFIKGLKPRHRTFCPRNRCPTLLTRRYGPMSVDATVPSRRTIRWHRDNRPSTSRRTPASYRCPCTQARGLRHPQTSAIVLVDINAFDRAACKLPAVLNGGAQPYGRPTGVFLRSRTRGAGTKAAPRAHGTQHPLPATPPHPAQGDELPDRPLSRICRPSKHSSLHVDSAQASLETDRPHIGLASGTRCAPKGRRIIRTN